MKKSNKPVRGAEALRERTSRLSAAILRISASLDVGAVLREVVDSARALTGARYGVITTVDEAGQPQDFVTSGLSGEAEQRLAGWLPDGLRLFEHLRDQEAPLRLDDFPGYVRSLGLATDRIAVKTLQATPMRHRGVHAGNFFLADKEGGDGFTGEDEEVLVLFASQAAAAIANARAHREEQRARASVEALVETSPVGVVVFDARNGAPVTFNREARRIVEALRAPGRSAAQLLEVVNARLADGREFTLAGLKSAETLRAIEVELSAPGGRSLRMLINVAPIRSGEGEVESVVVTMQDLAPLEEMERLRAEFLGMVSHELRSPLTSIKGSTTTLLGAPRALDRAEMRQFIRIIDQQADHMQGLISDLLDAGRIDSGTLSVDPEPLEMGALVEQARTTFLSGGGRQAIRIDLPPDLPRVMADERRIVQVLNNLFSNAARHSPESSPIEVGAVRDGIEVAVSVSDQGRGVAPEQLPRLFRRHAGIGGGERGREAAGIGLGLAICKGLVEAHGGRIRAESAGPGLGTRVTFTLPVAGEDGETAAPGALAGSSREGREPVPVLVVDDDPETLRYVRDTLAAAGYAPLVTGEPEEAETLVRTKRPHLVLLDLVLPGTDGIELMREVPGMADVPVIFISGYGRDETMVRALEAGAADYLVKPFSAAELTARVRAALRRRNGSEPFVLGELAIDYAARRVTVAGRPVELTLTEFELLRVLSLDPGRVVTYDSLLRQAWKGRHTANPQVVRNFVKKLRHKLGNDPAAPSCILNVRGVGYRMATPT
ncbi:MAG: response regulator [Deltaproteobacteria bacterium]|nr:response regulator [Deltaproteobacteria bacterium]